MGVKAGYKQTDVGLIPEDWEVKQIDDLEPFVTSGSRGWATFYSDRGSPFIRISNLSRACIYLDLNELRLVNLTMHNSEATRAQMINGDVLISITADIGIVGYVTANLQKPAYINQHIALMRFDSARVDSKFISYFLASDGPQKLFRALTDSGAKAGMNLATIQKIRIAVPHTKAEQEAIAEALSDTDALIEALEQLLAKKRHLKQGAMQELLTGKRRLPGFSGGWGVRRLGEVADTDPDNLGSDTRSNFTFNYIVLEDVDAGKLTSYSEEVFGTAPSRARRHLRKGDVLVSTVRPNLMSHLLFNGSDANWVCSTGFCVVRCRKGISHPSYVYSHMFAGCVARQIEALLTGSNYPAINSGDVRALQIPFPDYEEQTAIATVLSDMDEEITALETKLAKARQLKQGMMQELLTGRIRLV